LITGDILLEDGVWIGTRAVVCPGVRAGNHAVLAAGSVASGNLDAMTIYRGNPALPIKSREIQ
jgi:putative colanic acid biosynthesis acetyltransferase WcaF